MFWPSFRPLEAVEDMGRYERSIGTVTEQELERLQGARVAVVGCGGLGGYVLELLGRMGVGRLTAIDGDVFEESNLNRQLLSETALLGFAKAEAARVRMVAVNPEVSVTALQKWLTADNAQALLDSHDVIVDALDSIEVRRLLQKTAEGLGIPLVHGAIGSWYGQVATILPGDRTLDRLYPEGVQKGLEKELGNPSFTPALVASVQAAEVIKLLIGRGELLRNRVLRIDMLEQEYSLIDIEQTF